jgi:guanylate kinase
MTDPSNTTNADDTVDEKELLCVITGPSGVGKGTCNKF